ncbi:hypothetical protein [Arthrobacter sunyaminii]|uniref:Uncharacterized protein n=1 Tax=Arthrobacter sunyaminii TaxID=2816859 RepID=A0A975S6Q5_9MICC|nr:hypothetical protein [Arthrobacter sunyaminii]MBO0907781.1 hypothetical protein [Arthrobacter sunyaminii]QWQ36842.1 hypothetical protein KG104_03315 [Arthrobacter sunyaminii]
MTSQTDVRQLVDFITAELPRDSWTPWPGGWPDQIEAALIDAVLSISAKYGSETNGVRGAVARYRAEVDSDRPNDLARLSNQDPEQLQTVLNDQKVSGRTKASAIVEAAKNLLAVGVKSAADLDPHNAEQKKAYTAVHGLGWVTWEYFGMLLGKPGIKADRWIVRFAGRALGRDVTATEAKALLFEAAAELEATPTELDHAIWAHERDLRVPPL